MVQTKKWNFHTLQTMNNEYATKIKNNIQFLKQYQCTFRTRYFEQKFSLPNSVFYTFLCIFSNKRQRFQSFFVLCTRAKHRSCKLASQFWVLKIAHGHSLQDVTHVIPESTKSEESFWIKGGLEFTRHTSMMAYYYNGVREGVPHGRGCSMRVKTVKVRALHNNVSNCLIVLGV